MPLDWLKSRIAIQNYSQGQRDVIEWIQIRQNRCNKPRSISIGFCLKCEEKTLVLQFKLNTKGWVFLKRKIALYLHLAFLCIPFLCLLPYTKDDKVWAKARHSTVYFSFEVKFSCQTLFQVQFEIGVEKLVLSPLGGVLEDHHPPIVRERKALTNCLLEYDAAKNKLARARDASASAAGPLTTYHKIQYMYSLEMETHWLEF